MTLQGMFHPQPKRGLAKKVDAIRISYLSYCLYVLTGVGLLVLGFMICLFIWEVRK